MKNAILLPVPLMLWSILSIGSPARAQAPATPAAGANLLQGRIVDGEAMARAAPKEMRQAPPPEERQDLPRTGIAKPFILHLIEGPAAGKTWSGTADSEGRFQIPLDVSLPPTRCLVAQVTGDPESFSPAMVPEAGKEIEFRVYPATAQAQEHDLHAGLDLVYLLVSNQGTGAQELEVRVRLTCPNQMSQVYIGKPHFAGTRGREIFRVPVPRNARIVENQGPRGMLWVEHPMEGELRWWVIDSPIFPVIEESGGSVWSLTYRVAASQEMMAVYPLPLDLFLFTVKIPPSEDIKVDSPPLILASVPPNQEPFREVLVPGGPPEKVDVYFKQEVEAGTRIPVMIHIDNAKVGELNRGSVKIVLIFLLVVIGAAAAGLILARKDSGAGALDEALEDATGEELVARIAQLDQRFEAGEISKKEYDAARTKLVAMARYLVPELGGGPGTHQKKSEQGG